MKKLITILLILTFLTGCGGNVDKTITDGITNAIKKCAGDPECQKQVIEISKKVAEQIKK